MLCTEGIVKYQVRVILDMQAEGSSNTIWLLKWTVFKLFL